MSTELSCWQGFLNFLCCGTCYDNPQTQQQRKPLLKDQHHGTGVSSHRPPQVSTHDSYQRSSDRTLGLSVQQVEVQTGSHVTPEDIIDPVVVRRDEEERRSPSHSPVLDRRGGSSPTVVVQHEKEQRDSRPLPNPDAFNLATTPPESLVHHVDTPFVDRRQSRVSTHSSESKESLEPSTPPNSSLDVHGTPVSSPMSNKEKSPSKVVDVTSFMHTTGGSGNDSD